MTRIAAVRPLVFRAPIARPVITSFGRMESRPMVLVRIEDSEGAVGWGEVWCNFPSCGAEHRAQLVATVLAPLLMGREIDDPAMIFAELTRRTHVLAIQSGEPGPLAHAIAGIDVALWDLLARRRGEPLWRLLGGKEPRIKVYASGLNPDAPEQLAAAKRDAGYRAFKLKIGFGRERDIANLHALRSELGHDAELMVDANQAWDVETALEMMPHLQPFGLRWLEEPIAADQPWSAWQRLASSAELPLAAGENIAGEAAFETAIASGALRVVQPDMAKWGGFSGCVKVARRIVASGLTFCPHYLGGGIGLLASAHLLAAIGGGMLEVDANENILRSALAGPVERVLDGHAVLSTAPGLDEPPDLAALRTFRIL